MEIALISHATMPDTSPKKSESTVPFLELIRSASEVSVEELTGKRASAKAPGQARAFLVYVKEQVAPAPESPSAESYDREFLLKNASLLVTAQEWVLARHLYSLMLQRDIKDGDALKGLGVCLLRVGDRQSARKCFTALWDLHQREDALVWLGLCYSGTGDVEKAIVCYRKVRKPEGLDEEERFELWKDLGNCLARRGEIEEADEAYRQALRLAPDSSAVHVNRGMLELQKDGVREAKDHFIRALQLDGSCARALCGLGIVKSIDGDLSGAERDLSAALELDPRNQTALLQWLFIGHRLSDTGRLRACAETFFRGEPFPVEVGYAYAALLFQEARWIDCRRVLDATLAKSPAHAKAQRLREALGAALSTK